jgi:hypothetical protein
MLPVTVVPAAISSIPGSTGNTDILSRLPVDSPSVVLHVLCVQAALLQHMAAALLLQMLLVLLLLVLPQLLLLQLLLLYLQLEYAAKIQLTTATSASSAIPIATLTPYCYYFHL